VKRKFRLTKSNDFKRVRRNGRSYAHPLIVLVVLPKEDNGHSQFGISAGRSVGTAVRRNRAKRMLREALRSLMSDVIAGWDILLLSRHPLPDASLTEIQSALIQLLSRAGLLNETSES
jgi:ribonuclease P protein component